MKKFIGGVLVALLLCTAVPAMASELSGNVALTTDYVFRGISQTNEDPAIQGGFDFGAGAFYAGVWGSNVEFGSAAHVELDGYMGILFEYENGFSWDLGVAGYFYPSESESDYQEYYFGAGYNFFSAKYWYADDYVGLGGAGDYIEANLDFDLGRGFSLNLHGGQSSFDDAVGLEDYVDYGLTVAKEIGTFELSLGYTDTDIEDEPLADGRGIFTISKSL